MLTAGNSTDTRRYQDIMDAEELIKLNINPEVVDWINAKVDEELARLESHGQKCVPLKVCT